MLKSNEYKILDIRHENNTPLPTSNGRGEIQKLRIESIEKKVRLKKIKDINGMEILYSVVEKKN